ncbi:phosphate ABC transporter permease PstA [Actinoallomurus vinaceus]|uniref:Phosphate transport system permease protein PstA n=1 Tax=Actinoallomurus vinaceus TaxID=1080074 RepID=A0ABP8U7K9_9ACTN
MTTTTDPPAPGVSAPERAAEDPPDRPRRLRRRELDDVMSVIGAAMGAVGFVWLIYERMLPLKGRLGFVVCWYIAFLALYALIVGQRRGRVVVVDRVVSVAVHTAGFLVVGVLAVVIGFTAERGWGAVRHVRFFTTDLSVTGPNDPLTKGGILHGMVGTLEQIGIAITITVPLGIAAAVFLSEVGGRMARVVRTLVEAMTAIPSIVAGLFVYAGLIVTLGLGQSGMSAACAVSVMMLPIVIRASEVVLRLIPGGLREAALALGAPRWRMVWSAVLPTARSGLATAVVLAMARGLGETAPVLLTAGYTQNFNADPFNGPQVPLPLVAFNLVRKPEPEAIARGFGAALALLAMVLVLFVTARVLGGRPPGELSRRQRRRSRAVPTTDSEQG